jgi:hypothetical protein
MRILTVRQPWAWAIIHGGKDVENRVRNVAGAYRGPVAIHAGMEFDLARPSDAFLAEYSRLPVQGRETGYIIGVVDLVDSHPAEAVADTTLLDTEFRVEVTCCRSVWAEPDVQHLVLANPRPLVEPTPFKGALGLRTLDDGTTARVLAQIANGAPHD